MSNLRFSPGFFLAFFSATRLSFAVAWLVCLRAQRCHQFQPWAVVMLIYVCTLASLLSHCQVIDYCAIAQWADIGLSQFAKSVLFAFINLSWSLTLSRNVDSYKYSGIRPSNLPAQVDVVHRKGKCHLVNELTALKNCTKNQYYRTAFLWNIYDYFLLQAEAPTLEAVHLYTL